MTEMKHNWEIYCAQSSSFIECFPDPFEVNGLKE